MKTRRTARVTDEKKEEDRKEAKPSEAENTEEENKGPLNMTCAECKKSGDLACSKCYHVVYCSEEHQIKHWPQHETPCANYSLRRSPNTLYQGPFQITEEKDIYGKKKKGFQMTAKVDIPAQQKILDEKPILMAPWPRTKLRQCDDFTGIGELRLACLTCFGCCSVLGVRSKRCFHCNLPLCIDCPALHLHTKNECNVIKEYRHFRKKSTELDPRTLLAYSTDDEIEFLYQDIMMVRLILQFSRQEEDEFGTKCKLPDPKFEGFRNTKWNSLLQTWKRHEDAMKMESVRGTVAYKNLKDVFAYSLFLVKDVDLVWRLFCILEANAFTFHMPSQRFNVLCSLLPKIHHSCLPNSHAFLTYQEPKDRAWSGEFHDLFDVTVLSGKPIPEGTPITIPYLSLVFNVFERRLILLDRYLFWCRCERCLDPTELNTYVSSNTCHVCKHGYVIPPLDLLLEGPAPIPTDIFNKSEVGTAENDFKESLTVDKYEWSCNAKPCPNKAGLGVGVSDPRTSLGKQQRRSTAFAFDNYRKHEMNSVKCLGSYGKSFNFRYENQFDLHDTHSVLLKMDEDVLRGELYPPLENKAESASTENTFDVSKLVSLSYDVYEEFMKKVNPAFDFQGFPEEIRYRSNDDPIPRLKPRIRHLHNLFGIRSLHHRILTDSSA